MKKSFILLLMLFVAFAAKAQNSIPNGNFESWNTATYDYPQYYPFCSNIDNYYRYQIPFNLIKSTDAFHGTYAVQISTNASSTDTSFGYFVNAQPNGNPFQWVGGMAYNQQPTGFRGHFKYNPVSNDTAIIIIAFSKAGVNVGTYFVIIGGVHTSYTLFNVNFMPALAVTPDSVVIAAISSNIMAGHALPGSTLLLDSIAFTGVNSQPANLNGDFELWQSQTLDKPVSWISQAQPGSIIKTSDAYAGNYAIELKTLLGNMHNHPSAQSGMISTGYFDNGCMCMKGGFPFSNQVDTLVFHYKYTPAIPSDSAIVSLIINKNGAMIWGTGRNLPVAATYQYYELPFNAMQIPDTAIVQIQSSSWNDTLVSFVGSDLIIDEIHFKSQPLNTGIFKFKGNDDHISILPNPSTGRFRVLGSGFSLRDIEIYNSLGERVYPLTNFSPASATEIDLSGFPKGIYFVRIYNDIKSFTKQVVIQ